MVVVLHVRHARRTTRDIHPLDPRRTDIAHPPKKMTEPPASFEGEPSPGIRHAAAAIDAKRGTFPKAPRFAFTCASGYR